jgi:hypothetical protein
MEREEPGDYHLITNEWGGAQAVPEVEHGLTP